MTTPAWENARFGVYLTIEELERTAHLLHHEDRELSERFREVAERTRVALQTGLTTRRVA
jgi:hypothetical protein